MTTSLLFLSHIHEEKNLAIAIQNAVEEEFSGFVQVFVSSDGSSIPAGANFLKRIEDSLINCIGAIYLISPASVRRPWINFELGAVWIRSAISQRSGLTEIPALPLCHSGMTLGSLPAPLNNLNAIQANQPASLEFAFRSIQTAVGGRGKLRTDFNALARNVVDFELRYTFTDRFTTAFVESGEKIEEFILFLKSNTVDWVVMELNILNEIAQKFMDLAQENPAHMKFEVHGSGMGLGKRGMLNTVRFTLSLEHSFLVDRLLR